MELRDYQLECLKAIESKQDAGINRQMVVLPTGAGKTVIFSELIKDRNLKTLVIAHRIELLEQAKNKLETAAPEMSVGIFCGDEKCHDKQVTIASIQSASRPKALEILKSEGYQLLIIDEAHHAAAKTYRKLIEELGFHADDPKKLLVGFTATPKRGDDVGLDDLFQEIIYTLEIEKLVDKGFLVIPKGVHVKIGLNLDDVANQLGDFEKVSLKRVMNTKAAHFVVTSAIKKFAKDRQGIVFAVDIDHSEALKNAIVEEGFDCKAVHSKVPLDERRQILKDFSDGRLQFVANPMILTEGFDCPRADCMINVAPTMNKSLYIQKAGRVLRPHPDKEDALLIDFGHSHSKKDICTAAKLSGGGIEVQSVTKDEELFSSEEERQKALEFELIFDFDIHDPLGRGYTFRNETESKLFNSKYWKIGDHLITDNQIDYMKKLGRSTKTPVPHKKKIKGMSSDQASICINYLKAKKEHLDATSPMTFKQKRFIENFVGSNGVHSFGFSSISSLTKKQAHQVIGRFKTQSQSRNSFW